MSPFNAKFLSLLPHIKMQDFNVDIVDDYFKNNYPDVSLNAIDVLNGDRQAMSNTLLNLLAVTHQVSTSGKASDEQLKNFAEVLNQLEFKLALVFFVQAASQYSYNKLLQFTFNGSFDKRLDDFMGIFIPDILTQPIKSEGE